MPAMNDWNKTQTHTQNKTQTKQTDKDSWKLKIGCNKIAEKLNRSWKRKLRVSPRM